jgi:hypothetical protein
MTGEVVVSAASRHSSIACRAPDGDEVRSACRWRQARQGDHQAASVCVDGGQCGQGLVRESDRLGGVARGAAPFGAVAQQQRMVGKPPGPVLMARRGQVEGRPVDRYGVVGIGGRPDLEGRARHEQTRQARQIPSAVLIRRDTGVDCCPRRLQCLIQIGRLLRPAEEAKRRRDEAGWR